MSGGAASCCCGSVSIDKLYGSIRDHLHIGRFEAKRMRNAAVVGWAPPLFDPRSAPVVNFVDLELSTHHRKNARSCFVIKRFENRWRNGDYADNGADRDHSTGTVMRHGRRSACHAV
jgi:hypothetical protein